ncbi:MAG: anthranilate phosphoribosyltransferase [Terrimicrobiaceae bacterium]
MITNLTDKLLAGDELSDGDIRLACDELFDESADVDQRAAFLQALHERGETPREIAGFVRTLLDHAGTLPFSGEGCLDVCGTGGDRAGFFNVSTAVMFVAAACGVRVVKHGNRGITSKSGGADVLEALGVSVHLGPEAAGAALDSAGCCFLFAPNYHPAFKAVAPVRQLLAARGRTSVFNLLGPLLNPARPTFQLAGVFDPAMIFTYGKVFELLGRKRAWAVHGTGPDQLRLDEVSPLGTTRVVAWENDLQSEFSIEPSELGIPALNAAVFAGGTAAENAATIVDILSGNQRCGARIIVQLNAAAALVVAGCATNLRDGWDQAGAAIDDGAARAVLARLRVCR